MSTRIGGSRAYGGTYNTRNYSLFALNQKVNANIKATAQLASLLNVEFKHFDTAQSLSPGTVGTVYHLTAIAQGDGVQNRDGNQCKVVSVQARWQMLQNSSATVPNIVRMIWFMDTEQDATAPTGAELLETADTLGLFNYENRKRFVILRDMTISLGDQTVKDGQYYRKLNMIANWEGTTAASTRNNHIYFFIVSNEPTNEPTVQLQHRVRFLDN